MTSEPRAPESRASPGRPSSGLPSTVTDGVRWLATATLAVLLVTIAATLRGPDGPRPVPLALTGLVVLGLGIWQRRRRPEAPLGEAAVVLGAAVLLLGAEAGLRPEGNELDRFLAVAGGALVALGFVLDDRRPVVLGLVQWAVALGRPRPDADTFRHCLVATDLQIPHPQVLPVVVLGALVLAAAAVAVRRDWRLEATRGLETTGLTLLLGGLAAKALELPGHRALCGTGDAIDAGWAALLLAVSVVVGVIGVLRSDHLWAAAGLTSATLFSLAAVLLERNPWWGVVTGAPLLAILAATEHAGIRWPRRRPSP